MKANFLKIAKVKSEKDFYKKYPTEEAFFKAHPEARKMQHGGAATADQFFDYGMQAAGPLAAPETWYQDGGQYGGQTQLGGEAGDVDYSFINDFANMLYPDTEEEVTESMDEQSTEEEPTEDTEESFQIGGSKSAFNYGQFPALKSGGIQGGDINAAGSNIKENFLAGIRKYVADNELEQLNNEPSMDEASMGQYAQYGAQSGYGANYNPNLYNQEAWQGAVNAGQGKVQAGFNQLQDVLGENMDYVNQQNYADQEAKQQQAYNKALQKFVSGEMAKGVATPTGDVVSQPADAGQQTIDLAPNGFTYRKGGSKNYLPVAQNGMGWYTAEGKRVDTPGAGSTGYWDRVSDYWGSVLSGSPDWQNEEWLQKGIDPSTLKGKVPTMAARKAQLAVDKINPANANGVFDYLGNAINLPQKGVNLALTGNYESPGTTILRADPSATNLAFWADVLADPTNLVGVGELNAIRKGVVKAAPVVGKAVVKGAKYVAKQAPEVAKYVATMVSKYGPEILKNPYVQNVTRSAIIKGMSSNPQEQMDIQKQWWSKENQQQVYNPSETVNQPKVKVPSKAKMSSLYVEDLSAEERAALGL